MMSLVSPKRIDPLPLHHGLSTEHVDTMARLLKKAAGYSPNDRASLASIPCTGKLNLIGDAFASVSPLTV